MKKGIATATLLAFALATQTAYAADPTADPADDPATTATAAARTFAQVKLDGADAGTALVVIGEDTVLVPADDAARLHLPAVAAALVKIGDAAYVSLARLAPAVRYHFDDRTFELAIDLDAAVLGATTYGLAQTATPPPGAAPPGAARPPSAFVNYTITGESAGALAGFLEGGVSSRGALLTTSLSAGTGDVVRRGATTYARDDAAHLRRFLAGDVRIGAADALLGEIDVFGAGVQRAFDVDPYVATFPAPSVAGVIAAPGSAQVFVNGLLARTIPLAPGGFDLEGIPVSSGLSDVSVVVKDALGNERTYRQSYLGSDALLREGLTDYSYGAGFLRGSEAGAYGAPALAASYRIGASKVATLGVRFAATRSQSEIEGSGDLRVGPALFHLAEGLGDFAGRRGAATDATVAYASRLASLSLSTTLRSPAFGDLAQADGVTESARFELRAGGSLQVTPRSSLGVTVFRQDFASSPQQTTVLASLSTHLPGSQLLVTLGRNAIAGRSGGLTAGLSLTAPLGRRTTLGVDAASGGGGNDVILDVAPPSGDAGLGYSLRGTTTAASGVSGLATVVDHTPSLDLTGFLRAAPGEAPSATLSATGGIVLIAGHLLTTRPVGGAFVLVDSAGVGGIPVAVEGRPVGVTDRSGLLVVTSLGPYAPSHVTLDDRATPLGVEVPQAETVVAPGNRGGSVASFAVVRISYVVGTVTAASGTNASGTTTSAMAAIEPPDAAFPNAALDLDLGATHLHSTLDEAGGYYLENVPPGRYRATVRGAGGTCGFELVVPKSRTIAQDLGPSVCVPTP